MPGPPLNQLMIGASGSFEVDSKNQKKITLLFSASIGMKPEYMHGNVEFTKLGREVILVSELSNRHSEAEKRKRVLLKTRLCKNDVVEGIIIA